MVRCLVMVALFVSCATDGSPVLDRGTRRTAVAFELSSSELDIEGAATIDTDVFFLNGDIGWLVAKQAEVGAAASLLASETDDGIDNVQETLVALGPYARYYFTPTGGAIPFVDARIGYAGREIEVNGVTADGDGFVWSLSLGALVPLSSSVGFETSLTYFKEDSDLEGVNFENDGIALLVGIAAFF